MRSEGCNRFKNEIEKLYISMLSQGCECGIISILFSILLVIKETVLYY